MDTPLDALQQVEKKEKIDIAIALVVVLLAGIMLWTYGLGYLNTKSSAAHTSTVITNNEMGLKEVTVENTAYVPLAEMPVAKAMIAKPAAIAQKKVTQLQGAGEVQLTSGELSTVKPRAVEAAVATVIDTASTAEQEIAVDGIDSTIVMDADAEGEPKTIVTKPTESTDDPADNQTIDKSCVIIVGAYGSNKNADKMKARLAGAGYDVFDTPHRTLTRVGVYAPCKIERLGSMLKSIRKEFAADATVLQQDNQ